MSEPLHITIGAVQRDAVFAFNLTVHLSSSSSNQYETVTVVAGNVDGGSRRLLITVDLCFQCTKTQNSVVAAAITTLLACAIVHRPTNDSKAVAIAVD